MLYGAYVLKKKAAMALEEIVDKIDPVDWAQLINSLVKRGLSINTIGNVIGVSHETVRGWRDGSIPNYEAGRKLLIIFESVEDGLVVLPKCYSFAADHL